MHSILWLIVYNYGPIFSAISWFRTGHSHCFQAILPWLPFISCDRHHLVLRCFILLSHWQSNFSPPLLELMPYPEVDSNHFPFHARFFYWYRNRSLSGSSPGFSEHRIYNIVISWIYCLTKRFNCSGSTSPPAATVATGYRSLRY